MDAVLLSVIYSIKTEKQIKTNMHDEDKAQYIPPLHANLHKKGHPTVIHRRETLSTSPISSCTAFTSAFRC